MNQISPFETTTNQLTTDRSTTELLRNNGRKYLIEFNSRSQPMTNMSSKLPSLYYGFLTTFSIGPSYLFLFRTQKLKETSETKESEEETDKKLLKRRRLNRKKRDSPPSPFLFLEEKEIKDKIDEMKKIRVNGKDKTKDEFHCHLKEKEEIGVR
ncbi:hypothetical protein Cgig2_028257 [Carnegiea gigantea]|uniref:Protein TIC 214 n=1 Tax=Carnegiea gigantea TaxID=171969 RepID=A0A9Q1GN79_9CARY|nr:hypothetical protein Cgig2_028257 [Carnegiea gigantea]